MGLTYRKVLVAVDGSRESEWAFQKSIEISKRNNASLIIAHIIDTRAFATVEAYDLAITERADTFAVELLTKYKQIAEQENVTEVFTVKEFGSPKIKISKEIAPKHEIDLIVCGATGLNAIERFFIGSVSEHITRYAKCDVLIVRTEKE